MQTDNPKEILIWVPVLDFKRGLGGAELLSLRLAGGLVDRENQVTVCASRIDWKLPAWDTIELHGREIAVLWLPSPNIWLLGSLIYLASLAFYLFSGKIKCQVVHIGSINRVAAAAILIARLAGTRVVCRVIGGDARLLAQLVSQKRLVAQFHISALKYSHAFIAQSDHSKQILISLGIDAVKIIQIQNGIDTDYFTPFSGAKRDLRAKLGLPTEGKIICCANRLRPLKRVDVVLRAFQNLQSQGVGVNCFLLIVGKGTELKNLQALDASLGISDKVRFQGWVADPLIYLQASDIFVLGSENENLSNG